MTHMIDNNFKYIDYIIKYYFFAIKKNIINWIIIFVILIIYKKTLNNYIIF